MATFSANVYARDRDFWTIYEEGRPKIPDSFFERIVKYHKAHGGAFDTVHDAGAGPGIHSARIGNQFDKVIISDVSQQNIAVAETRLKASKYHFHVAKLEDTASLLPSGSVDMVFASTVLHFTSIPDALSAVARQLKSGGTFAAPLLGVCALEDPELDEAWARVFNAGCEQLIDAKGDQMVPTIRINASAYDAVPLPETYFRRRPLRIKINETLKEPSGGHYYSCLIPPALREQYPPLVQAGPSDMLLWENDETFSFEKDIEGLEAVVGSFPFDQTAANFKKVWADFERALGNQKVKGRWVVSLLLATRQ